MILESQNFRAGLEFFGQTHGFGDQGLVTPVDAVKNADGQDDGV
jgi:hypothetical protein